jgi:hypothetical protein
MLASASTKRQNAHLAVRDVRFDSVLVTPAGRPLLVGVAVQRGGRCLGMPRFMRLVGVWLGG